MQKPSHLNHTPLLPWRSELAPHVVWQPDAAQLHSAKDAPPPPFFHQNILIKELIRGRHRESNGYHVADIQPRRWQRICHSRHRVVKEKLACAILTVAPNSNQMGSRVAIIGASIVSDYWKYTWGRRIRQPSDTIISPSCLMPPLLYINLNKPGAFEQTQSMMVNKHKQQMPIQLCCS